MYDNYKVQMLFSSGKIKFSKTKCVAVSFQKNSYLASTVLLKHTTPLLKFTTRLNSVLLMNSSETFFEKEIVDYRVLLQI